MQAPKLPSLFKTITHKSFSFSARYYNERKEKIEQLKKNRISSLKFKKRDNKYINTKERMKKIFFFIIILSLLAYQLIYN